MKGWWRALVTWSERELRLVFHEEKLVRRLPGSAALAFAAGVLAGAVSTLIPPWYVTTSHVMVVSSTSSGPTGLAALAAAQLGVGTGTQVDPATPQFVTYATTTNAVADSVLAHGMRTVDTVYRAAGHYLSRDSAAFAASPGRARLNLRNMITVTSDLRLPVLSIEVSAADPQASLDIHNSLLAVLAKFVLQNQTTNGRAQREFTERELLKARSELFKAEQGLTDVLTRNRNVTNSPEFTFEITQLRRRVDQASQLEANLTQQLQSARLVEARDTPALVILDPPELPQFPRGPRYALIGLVIGLLVLGVSPFLRPLWQQFGGGATTIAAA